MKITKGENMKQPKLKNEKRKEGLLDWYFQKVNNKNKEVKISKETKGKNFIQRLLGW